MAIAKTNATNRSSSLHPPYFQTQDEILLCCQMISEAITTMKDRTGSSQPAIAKFMEVNYTKQLPPNFKKILSVQLKRFVKSEKLVKVKNSYKLFPEIKNVTKQPSLPSSSANEDKRKPEKKNAGEKAIKTKRLSQVKTPEGFEKTKANVAMKRKVKASPMHQAKKAKKKK